MIGQVLGKHVKILLKTSVKLEKGGDKTDNRILVFTPHRMFVMTAKELNLVLSWETAFGIKAKTKAFFVL